MLDETDHILLPLNGRYIVECDRVKVRYLDKSMRNDFTLFNASEYDGSGPTLCFIIEAQNGYLWFERSATEPRLLEVGPFEKFDVKQWEHENY